MIKYNEYYKDNEEMVEDNEDSLVNGLVLRIMRNENCQSLLVGEDYNQSVLKMAPTV